jgi:hypothetical protein
MALLDRIQTDMQAAMRAKDELKLNAIRMIKAALKKHEVDSMKPLDEAAELQILGTLIKQRREAADMPAAPSDQEIADAITAAISETGVTSVKQMGVVMKAAQAKLAGKRVDGKALSEKVRARLS